MWRWKNTRTQWKLRSLGKHRTGELSSHVWWHRRLLIYHTWVKNWQIYAKARAMKWGLLVDYHRFTLPMSFQWRRPSHHTRQRHEVTGAENGHAPCQRGMVMINPLLPGGPTCSWTCIAYYCIFAYTHIHIQIHVCVYIHRKYMYPYRPTYIYIYIHTIPYH